MNEPLPSPDAMDRNAGLEILERIPYFQLLQSPEEFPNFKKKQKVMKTMTCQQLGGACEKEFRANSFEEIAEMSKKHGMEMSQKGDQAHIQAMNKMQEMMKEPGAMEQWFEQKKRAFDALPEDE